MKQKTEKEIEKILECTDLKDKEVLEIGCGNGRMSSFLVNEAKNFFAVDTNEKNIKSAKSKIKNAKFFLCSGENLNFWESSFDVIIFTFSLHHQNSEKALSEAHRVLRKEGQVIVLEPMHDTEAQKFFNAFEDETEKILRVLEIIKKSALFEIERNEIFAEKMIFENRNEMYQYFSEYYTKKLSDVVKEINLLLGDKINSKPIVLKDKLRIFSLRKK